MIKTGFLILLVVNSLVSGKCPSVREARQLYRQAAGSKGACNDLITRIQSCPSTSDPVLTGYQAAATMMMAQYVVNPFSKLSWFRKGRKLLDNTLAQHPGNAELRFLRFTIQTNAPGMLGYNDEISADKTFLLNALSGLTDASLQQSICDYLQQSKYVSDADKQQLLKNRKNDQACAIKRLIIIQLSLAYLDFLLLSLGIMISINLLLASSNLYASTLTMI